MKSYAAKVKEAREILGLSQAQLARQIGVSTRSITAYETGVSRPRGTTARKLAQALLVSVDYLLNDEMDDPKHGLEKFDFVEDARQRFGNQGAKEASRLLEQTSALFAGGQLSQEAKDAFFQAVMTAYVTCKEEAKKTFGRNHMESD